MQITAGTRLTDLSTGKVIEVIDTDGHGRYTVASVNEDGKLGLHRNNSGSNFFDSYTNKKGVPRMTGYVPTRLLPFDHPFAVRPEEIGRTLPAMPDEIDFEAMDDETLLSFSNRMIVQMRPLEAMLAAAKEELRKRYTSAGTVVHGDVAMLVKAASRTFAPKAAKVVLSGEEYSSICVLKPDAERAKVLLDEETYMKCSTEKKSSLEIRFATAADREKAAQARSAAASPESETMEIA